MKPSARQVAVLRNLPDIRTHSISTWAVAGQIQATPPQVRRDLTFLERNGLARRADPKWGDSGVMWGRTTSGAGWLAQLDAGRPWMVRGYKR